MTKIEWADKTWNPVTGCTPISEGCENCYGARMAKRLTGRCGYPADDPFRVTIHPDRFNQPLKWKKPSRIFVCSMGDILHPHVEPIHLAVLLNIMKLCPQHTFMVLTKRPERMTEDHLDNMMISHYFDPPMPNVWLGVTAENQQRADERIPILLQIPAAVRFVSVEPCLGPVEIRGNLEGCGDCDRCIGGRVDQCTFKYYISALHPEGINWVICGGETGPGARPMNYYWAASLRDQCVSAGVPFFFKQWGEWIDPTQMGEGVEFPAWGKSHLWHGETGAVRVGKKAAGRLLDGREHNEYPDQRS